MIPMQSLKRSLLSSLFNVWIQKIWRMVMTKMRMPELQGGREKEGQEREGEEGLWVLHPLPRMLQQASNSPQQRRRRIYSTDLVSAAATRRPCWVFTAMLGCCAWGCWREGMHGCGGWFVVRWGG
jgi:hypothetical protein